MLRGIDVSHWQGSVDWHGLAASQRLDFGFCKATEHEGFVDPRFRSNWAAIREAGLVRGAYHFARPDSDPRDDAGKFVAVVKAAGLKATDLLALDLETGNGLTASQNAAWSVGWGREVKRLCPGFSVGVYSSYLFKEAYRILSPKHGGPFDWWWLPQWPGSRSWPAAFTPRASGNFWGDVPDFWQFTDAALGKYDGDVFNGTRAELEALNPGAGRPNPTPPPKPHPTPDPGPTPALVRTISRLLRVADPLQRGEDVRAVQRLVGMNASDCDGIFGHQTEWHVKDWQHDRRLTVDGVFGPQCCRAAGWRWAG